jgi:hypothetical protein
MWYKTVQNNSQTISTNVIENALSTAILQLKPIDLLDQSSPHQSPISNSPYKQFFLTEFDDISKPYIKTQVNDKHIANILSKSNNIIVESNHIPNANYKVKNQNSIENDTNIIMGKGKNEIEVIENKSIEIYNQFNIDKIALLHKQRMEEMELERQRRLKQVEFQKKEKERINKIKYEKENAVRLKIEEKKRIFMLKLENSQAQGSKKAAKLREEKDILLAIKEAEINKEKEEYMLMRREDNQKLLHRNLSSNYIRRKSFDGIINKPNNSINNNATNNANVSNTNNYKASISRLNTATNIMSRINSSNNNNENKNEEELLEIKMTKEEKLIQARISSKNRLIQRKLREKELELEKQQIEIAKKELKNKINLDALEILKKSIKKKTIKDKSKNNKNNITKNVIDNNDEIDKIDNEIDLDNNDELNTTTFDWNNFLDNAQAFQLQNDPNHNQDDDDDDDEEEERGWGNKDNEIVINHEDYDITNQEVLVEQQDEDVPHTNQINVNEVVIKQIKKKKIKKSFMNSKQINKTITNIPPISVIKKQLNQQKEIKINKKALPKDLYNSPYFSSNNGNNVQKKKHNIIKQDKIISQEQLNNNEMYNSSLLKVGKVASLLSMITMSRDSTPEDSDNNNNNKLDSIEIETQKISNFINSPEFSKSPVSTSPSSLYALPTNCPNSVIILSLIN